MPFARQHGCAPRLALAAALLALGSPGSAAAQLVSDDSEHGGAEAVGVEVEGRPATIPVRDDAEEKLFAGGPREPGVLSAEGALIGTGVRKLPPPEEDDAVAALVVAATADAKTPPPAAGEAEEERRRPSGLLGRLGGWLGLGGD